MRRRTGILAAACAAVLLVSAAPAAAQTPGVRAGVSVDPDQFYVGGHFETDEIADNLHFRPNLELGLGGDLTTIAINLELVYKVPLKNRDWTFYGGGGPAINFYDRDDGRGGSDTGGGLNFVFGLEHRDGLFFETKVGVVDSPNLKVGIGYSFK